jgi:ankyrin repeat protein
MEAFYPDAKQYFQCISNLSPEIREEYFRNLSYQDQNTVLLAFNILTPGALEGTQYSKQNVSDLRQLARETETGSLAGIYAREAANPRDISETLSSSFERIESKAKSAGNSTLPSSENSDKTDKRFLSNVLARKILTNDLDGLVHLLNSGIPAKIRGNNGNTLLMLAAAEGNLDIMRELIRRDPDLVNLQNDDGKTALYISLNNEDVRQLLLESGANPNIETKKGKTPLQKAASLGDTQGVKDLLEHSADPSHVPKKGILPPLFISLIINSIEIAQLLVNAGTDTNQKEPGEGATPYMTAALANKPQLLEFILENGGASSIFVTNLKGLSALQWAEQNNVPAKTLDFMREAEARYLKN